jgi:hypothetical protein
MNVTALTAPAATNNWKRVGWILLLLGGIFAAGNGVMFMLVEGTGRPTSSTVSLPPRSPVGRTRSAARSRR